MNRLLLLIVPIVFASCSYIRPINGGDTEKSAQEPIVTQIQQITLQPGMASFYEFPINLEDGRNFLKCKESEVPFMVKNKKAMIYLSETYFSNMKGFVCHLILEDDENVAEEIAVLNVEVKPYKYKSERLYVDKKRVTLSKKDQERVAREREITKKIYANSASYYLFDEPFKVPLNSYITSHYGTRRIFNNKKKSSHLGNDFRAAIGVPIPVANKGKVVFIGNLFYSGNVVIVDHGMNIFSLYAHLSKFKVTEGSIINKGDIVGLAGMTGRVSGPHLHWGVKVNGNAIDGFSLVEASKGHHAKDITPTVGNTVN
jgi:murein DD-endopeptidase MepM/ murein hydrolase activator NlpD